MNQVDKPNLLILSDLWGTSKMEWYAPYKLYLDDIFDIEFSDSRELAGISLDITEEEVLHQLFVSGGIVRAVNALISSKKEYTTILGMSVGGTIGWQALNRD